MRTIYETDDAGRPTGFSIEIDDTEGRPLNWAPTKPPEDMSDPVWIGTSWVDGKPIVIIQIDKVFASQAKTALYEAGLYEQVNDLVQAHTLVKIWWESAGEWKKDHPYITMVAIMLELSEDQINALFEAASKVPI